MGNLNKSLTLRSAIEQNSELEVLYGYEYSFKWSGTQENFRHLDDILEELGYKIISDDYIPGEYNDIKGYLDFLVEEI